MSKQLKYDYLTLGWRVARSELRDLVIQHLEQLAEMSQPANPQHVVFTAARLALIAIRPLDQKSEFDIAVEALKQIVANRPYESAFSIAKDALENIDAIETRR